MEQQINLKATPRDLLGKKVKILREKDQIPAILYGQNFKPLPLTLERSEFIKIARQAGEATLINLDIAQKEPVKILIRDIQKEPVHDGIIHVDFYKVDMSKEIQTEIPINFVGVSPAVEELEGNFITNKDSIKVECLPEKLVSEINVDIASLKTFEDLIHLKDLNIPEGIKVLDEMEDIICQVTPPRSEEEMKEMEEETAATTEKAQIENIEAEAEAEKAEAATEEAESEASKEAAPAPEHEKNEKQ